jgi:Arc/MetJ family transcription regulator
MSRTLVEIPDELLAEARRIAGPGASKAGTVRLALTEMVRRNRQLEALEWFAESDALGDLNDSDVRGRARS